MPKGVALQADLGNIPSNSIAVLSTPLLRALSADNVHLLAMVQVEAIGACFQINGPFAAKVPDLLVRSTSFRLERISQYVGWLAGDTASAMTHTAGGRAGSLLSMVLAEVYGQESTGYLLYNLSLKILPAERNHSSMIQIGQVAHTLALKLAALGYGNT